MKLRFWSIAVSAAGLALSLNGHCQARNVIVRPKEIHDILDESGNGHHDLSTLQTPSHLPWLALVGSGA
jgi:hypothetical protein